MLNTEIQIGKYRFEVLAINGNVIKQVKATPIYLTTTIEQKSS